MELLVFSLVLLALSGLCSLSALFFRRMPDSCGPLGAVAASCAGMAGAIGALWGRPQTLSLRWSLPGASFSLLLDPLSALFLIPLFLLCGLGAIYALGYVRARRPQSFFLYNLLCASMALVFTASNAVLFLVSWELMTVLSFLFVVWDVGDPRSREAGWTYLVATHIGTAFLLALFALAWSACGSAEFADFPRAFRALPFGAVAGLALAGFGTKAGFFPLHVWLPRAHPAAPSHISALMSGIMIKTGIYGILRLLSLCPQPPLWFALLLIGIGVLSGLLGVLLALAQHDLKQLLAYSSVENMGIIAIGLGIGYAALALGRADIALFGFCGGLLHVVNHAIFKSLLFLGAGSVQHGAGTRDMGLLGGLQKHMPVTAACFLVGATSISALPPFNGFISELLIYAGAFKTLSVSGPAALAGLFALATLAAIGALASACFANALGVTLLGLPRSAAAQNPHEAPPSMLAPLLALALLCAGLGLAPMLAFPALATAAGQLLPPGAAAAPARELLFKAGLAGLCLLGLGAALWCARKLLPSGKKDSCAPTWACAYSAVTPRMQYSASSFAQPLLNAFGINLKVRQEPVRGLFPGNAGFHSEAPDMAKTRLYQPLFELLESKLALLRKIQHGNIHAYMLYIAGALALLLTWALL